VLACNTFWTCDFPCVGFLTYATIHCSLSLSHTNGSNPVRSRN
jgi:hypothetical protein